jgi:hypothetical protein
LAIIARAERAPLSPRVKRVMLVVRRLRTPFAIARTVGAVKTDETVPASPNQEVVYEGALPPGRVRLGM